MRYLLLAVIVTASTCFAAAADNPYGAAPTSARVASQVAIADQADLSPREPGIIKDVTAEVGKRVKAGDLLLQLDDTKAQQDLLVARAKLKAAETKANDDVNERYSKAAAEVAKKEYDYNIEANHKVPGAVPKAKLDELQLKCIETSLAIEKAAHERRVAESDAGIAAAEVEAAKTMIELLKVYSPIDGEVVEVQARKGEAVQPTKPGVIHIVGLNRVWVEGQVSAKEFAREQLDNQPVTVEVAITKTQKLSVPGKITYVNPLTDAGESYMVRAEVQSEKLHPGMRAEMIIPLKPGEVR